MATGKKIITKASDLFMQYGFKSISMDEVARHLGISKKTLYQHVNNKADLIQKVMITHIAEEKLTMLKIHENAKDAIDEMMQISQYVSELLQRVNPSVVYDLQKYYSKGWELMESLHLNHTYKMIKENIKNGIQEGLYRQNLSPEIIAKLYIGRMDLVIDKNLFPVGEYTFSQIHNNAMMYHLYGIMSTKGIELFEKYRTKNN
jgi:AcrR family transcriptional regulator